jgi:Zn-dependent protease
MADRRLGVDRSRQTTGPSPVFVGLVALWVTGGVMAWQDYGSAIFNVILFVVAGWLVSLSLHEYAHAVIGYHSGDRSVVDRGYLTLNPLKYTHPVLSVALPLLFLLLGGIGLPGGAVWLDRHAIRGRLRNSLVSAAGPAVNVLFLLALLVPFVIGVNTGTHRTFWAALAFLAFLQLTASVLNLVPIPGVDGGGILRPWLSPSWGKGFDMVAPYGMLILFALLWEPRVATIFWTVVFGIGDVIGLPATLVAEGHDLVLFWR